MKNWTIDKIEMERENHSRRMEEELRKVRILTKAMLEYEWMERRAMMIAEKLLYSCTDDMDWQTSINRQF